MRGTVGLLAWQWQGYAENHQSNANLWLHIALVPLFLAGNVALIVSFATVSPGLALDAVGAMVLSMFLQGVGHKREPVQPAPFSSAFNALARIFLEQWITFPRFVLTGGWWRALHLNK